MGHDSPRASLPAVHLLHLVELLERYSVSQESLFAGLPVDAAQLGEPSARLDIDLVNVLIARARALSGEPGIGVLLGMQMRVSAHGFLGFAAMTAATLGDALELSTRYVPTRTDALGLRLERDGDGDGAALIIDELVDLGEARDAIVLALVVGLATIGTSLSGRLLPGEVELAFPRPSYADRMLGGGRGTLRFDRPDNRLRLPRSVLTTPIALADPTSQRLAREQCERELAALGEGALLLGQVQRLARHDAFTYRSVEQVARLLGLSTRTLKRRLQSQGHSYSGVVDALRRESATSLLRTPELSIEQVAERLGYSDAANFTRAFKRWTGSTPAAYRRRRMRP
jgi:AraC-like DNA-binding protein